MPFQGFLYTLLSVKLSCHGWSALSRLLPEWSIGVVGEVQGKAPIAWKIGDWIHIIGIYMKLRGP